MTTTPLARAAERLNGLHASRPDVVRLAQTACIAVRVEPHLLRRLRIDCVPHADVGAEADLWFSRLVESRGTQAIVLDRFVVQLLRDHLSRERDLLVRVIDVTARAHATAPRALQLEERINSLALLEGEAARPVIDELLKPALRSLKESDERGRDIARWWLRAAPRLHADVWRSGHALALLVGASALLQRRIESSVAALPPDSIERLAWALPAGIDVGHLELSVELRPDRLAFSEPRDPAPRIRVPATTPPIVDVRWRAGGENRRVVREVTNAFDIELGVEPTDVTLRTLRGAVYAIQSEPDVMAKRTCFVTMPFGKKTDLETGRLLDMDQVYRIMIKPAAESAGYDCLRADEIVHSGFIDVPLYEQLWQADVVIADLSTSNLNVAYELGVRHALRPSATIVICEDGKGRGYPFYSGQILIRTYHHLGDGIDFEEAERFRHELAKVLKTLDLEDAADHPDSPVYNFLPKLVPPQHLGGTQRPIGAAEPQPGEGDVASSSAATRSALMQAADEAQSDGDFATAKRILESVRQRMRSEVASGGVPEDPYIIQRLALATYKSKLPSAEAALTEARELLQALAPATSSDAETLGLWGAVHKRLWGLTQDRRHLDEAIRAHERGFFLRKDDHNGINLAYLLNVRAAASDDIAEAIADFVTARRVRREVVALSERLLADYPPGEKEDGAKAISRFWRLATRAEALVGLGEPGAEAQLEEAYANAPSQWMVETTREQLAKLRSLLANSPLSLLDDDVRRRWQSRRSA